MRLNITLKGYWVRFAPVPMDRYMGEWLYYNFAAGSFHIKKLCSRLYSTEIEFYFLKSLFEPPFAGLRGNVHTQSIGRWKAHGRLPIRHN